MGAKVAHLVPGYHEMRDRRWVLAAAATAILSGCASSPAPAPHSGSPPEIDGSTPKAILTAGEERRIKQDISAKYRGKIRAAEALGRIVYEHAALAEAAAKRIGPEWGEKFSAPPAGWLTQRSANHLYVLFLVRYRGNIAVAATAKRTNSGKLRLISHSPPHQLTARQQALWQARQLAFTEKFKPCAKRYDPVVVPVRAGGTDQIGVYLLPRSPDTNRLFLGGYQLVTVNAAGNRIVHHHAFTHSCAALERTPRTVGAAVTEVESSTPTAPQVYASLAYGLPIRVTTPSNGLVWRINHGQISLRGKHGRPGKH